ncbi:MAG: zinc ribbon domain-containing protein [Bacteroidia bacterium]|nr:zinc ribbon domain-containing protein [Bacteroidia bacterium]
MYCIYCGTKISDNSRFCTECGKRVEPVSMSETGSATGKPAPAISDAVKLVLSKLKDNDIYVPDSKDDIRVPFSNSQNDFFHLIKKGML